MLRTRLLTSLVFNAIVALWVFHDARARGARKPAFASGLALVWGPLGLGLWESDRPLRPGEQRRGTAHAVARGFLIGWLALLPAMAVLALQAVEHRAAVPGSLGRQIGIGPATTLVVSMLWGVTRGARACPGPVGPPRRHRACHAHGASLVDARVAGGSTGRRRGAGLRAADAVGAAAHASADDAIREIPVR